MTNRTLHGAATRALDVLYQHRLLTTSQIREMVLPGRGARWAQQVFAELAERGFIDSIPGRRAWPRPAERVWFLTDSGADVVGADPGRPETRRRVVTAQLAAGGLQAHTLAVNEVGIAFLRAARQRGHDFGPESWRHEVAHDLRTGPRQPADTLIADAVLRYWMAGSGGAPTVHYRFLELDRATLQMDDLASRLARYALLHRRWSEHWALGDAGASDRRPAWPFLYRAFPAVMVVLANPERANLRRRMETVMALCRSEPVLGHAPAVSIAFALLEDLIARSPFAPIFRRLEDDRTVDWLGSQDGLSARHGAAQRTA